MKLQHKIAGTILLPLAAAAMISTAQAADVKTYGRIQVHVNESTPKSGDMDFSASGAESRFGFIAENGMGAKGHFEFDLNAGTATKASPRLRHAYVTFDGITVGQTWKPSAVTELLFPAIDPNTNALGSAPSTRAPQVSTKLDLGAGSSLNVGVYDDATNVSTAVPAIAAKYVGNMEGFKLVAAFDMQQKDGTKNGAGGNTDSKTVLTLGAVADLGGMEVKAAYTNQKQGSVKANFLGASVSVPMGDGMKFNAAMDTESESKSSAMWVNVMTKTASGVDLGAEFRSYDKAYAGAPAAMQTAGSGTVIAFMANYNF